MSVNGPPASVTELTALIPKSYYFPNTVYMFGELAHKTYEFTSTNLYTCHILNFCQYHYAFRHTRFHQRRKEQTHNHSRLPGR